MAGGIRVVGRGVKDDDKSDLPAPRPPKQRRTARKDGAAAPKPAASARAEAPKAGEGKASSSRAAAMRVAASAKPAARPPVKLWEGRLGQTAAIVDAYSSSIHSDRRLYAEDIEASQAHALMLKQIGVLNATEWRAIDTGLRSIRREFDSGEFVVEPTDEDIHSAVERRLHDVAGDVAGKLHTGRSRNDQIATDMRLYAKRVCREMVLSLAELQETLLRRSEEHHHTVLPGYTHGQRAQVVSLAHHLLAYAQMLQRDVERFMDAHDRCDVLPLGSGALAGSTLKLDRALVAARLDFDGLSANSLDAVADRDFVAEIIFACALTMVHISRLGEEIVLWSSAEYGFADLPDAYATGSSLMPQKKNPDVLELARGRSARVIGDVTAILTLLKGLPLAYNRDLQEDKVSFFEAVDVTAATLRIVTEVMAAITFDADRMRTAASDPGLFATDVAEYLVHAGVPFREAHRIVARTVARLQRTKKTLADLTAEQWHGIDEHFGPDVVSLFDVDRSLRRRELPGGPGPRSVSRQMVRLATTIAKTRRAVTVLARETAAAREVGGSRRT